jgi:hypothetical protein
MFGILKYQTPISISTWFLYSFFFMLHPVPEELKINKDSKCACYTHTGCIYLPLYQYNKVSGMLVVILEFGPLLHFHLPLTPGPTQYEP